MTSNAYLKRPCRGRAESHSADSFRRLSTAILCALSGVDDDESTDARILVANADFDSMTARIQVGGCWTRSTRWSARRLSTSSVVRRDRRCRIAQRLVQQTDKLRDRGRSAADVDSRFADQRVHLVATCHDIRGTLPVVQ